MVTVKCDHIDIIVTPHPPPTHTHTHNSTETAAPSYASWKLLLDVLMNG